jgi:hypothetical protein
MGTSTSKQLQPSIEGAVVASDHAEFKPVFQGNHAVTLPPGVSFTQARDVLFAGGAAAKAVVCLSELADPASFSEVTDVLPWEERRSDRDGDCIARYTFTERVPIMGPLATDVKLFVAQRVLTPCAAGDVASSSAAKSATMLYESRTDKGVWVRKCRTVRQDDPASAVVVAEAFQGVISPLWASMAGAKAADAHAKHMELYKELDFTRSAAEGAAKK